MPNGSRDCGTRNKVRRTEMTEPIDYWLTDPGSNEGPAD